jgi:hypothetical protein
MSNKKTQTTTFATEDARGGISLAAPAGYEDDATEEYVTELAPEDDGAAETEDEGRVSLHPSTQQLQQVRTLSFIFVGTVCCCIRIIYSCFLSPSIELFK